MALVRAVLLGRPIDIAALLASGADAGVALTEAAFFGRSDIVEHLLNVTGVDVNATDAFGGTALINAVFNTDERMVDVLLKRPGINVHAIDADGDSALSIAINIGEEQPLAKLLDVLSDDNVAAARAFAAREGHDAALLVFRWRARRVWISLCLY